MKNFTLKKTNIVYLKPISPQLTLISLILSSLFFNAQAAPITLNDTTLTIDNELDINTNSSKGAAGYAISVSNNGHLTANESINLLTGGTLAHGIYLDNNSSVNLLRGGAITITSTGNGISSNNNASITSLGPLSVTTNGRTTYAVHGQNSGSVALTQGEILTKGINGSGVVATTGGHVTLSGTNITTTNNNARAVWATGADSLIEIDNAIISTLGGYTTAYTWGSRGISAETGSLIKLSNSTISTKSQQGFGIYAASAGAIELNNTEIETQGDSGHGLRAYGTGSQVTSTGNLLVNTMGNTAHAAFASLDGEIDLGTGAQLYTAGSTSNAINIISGGGTITGKDVTLKTSGSLSRGIFIDSVDATESTPLFQTVLTGNSTINTTGEESYGVWAAGKKTNIDIENVSLITEGSRAFGLNAQRGATITAGQATISTLGEQAYGAVANLGSRINLSTGSMINTQGDSAFGLWASDDDTQLNALNTSVTTSGLGADTVVASKNGTVTLTQTAGQLVSAQGTNFSTNGGTINAILDGSYISNSGVLISAIADSDENQGNVNLQVNNLAVQGNIFADQSSIADFSMHNAQWKGFATRAREIQVDEFSRWDMNHDSDTTNLSNSGVINFMSAVPGNILTVHKNYSGNNAHLIFNTVLGDDNSATDKMVVEGNTSGLTNVTVNNIGGLGAQTLNGIELIHVNGLSDGEFKQAGRIVAGAYDYSLVRGIDENAGNWYLASTAIPITPGAKPNSMIERTEAGSYIANLAAANNMFVTRLHDRLGETQYIDALTGEQKVTSMWIRNQGGHNRAKDNHGQLSTQSNRYVLQLGGDIAQWSNNDLDRWHLGLMAGYANGQSHTNSSVSGHSSRGSVDGYSAGIYATWYDNDADKTGLYVDTWAQYSWFDNTVKGQDLENETYKSKGVTSSIESGYTFKIGENAAKGETYFIQPKAQVIWMGVKANDRREANGTQISDRGDGNIQTRLGVKAFINGHHPSDNGKDREFQPFIEANWLHNTRDFGTAMNGVEIKQDGAQNVGELKLGIEGKINNKVNLWSNVAQQIGDKGYSDTAVIFGVKYNF